MRVNWLRVLLAVAGLMGCLMVGMAPFVLDDQWSAWKLGTGGVAAVAASAYGLHGERRYRRLIN